MDSSSKTAPARLVRVVAQETVSGVCGGLLSATLTYPLDLIKTRRQVDDRLDQETTWSILKQIAHDDGIAGLFVGLPSEFIKVVVQNGSYFAAHAALKRWLGGGAQGTGLMRSLFIGILAGSMTQILVNPVSVVQTRIQMQRQSSDSFRKVVLDMIKQEGGLAFYKGMSASMILTLNPAISFVAFDKLKSWWVRVRQFRSSAVKETLSADDLDADDCNNTLTPIEVFLIGAIAKTLATVITYPYIMAKARLQFDKGVDKNSYAGVMDVVQRTIALNGFLALYKGMQTQIVKSVLTSALMFMFKDAIQIHVKGLFKQRRTLV